MLSHHRVVPTRPRLHWRTRCRCLSMSSASSTRWSAASTTTRRTTSRRSGAAAAVPTTPRSRSASSPASIGIALLLVGVVSRLAGHRPRRVRHHVRRRHARDRPAAPPHRRPVGRRRRRAARPSFMDSLNERWDRRADERRELTPCAPLHAPPRRADPAVGPFLLSRARSELAPRVPHSRHSPPLSLHLRHPCILAGDSRHDPRKWGRMSVDHACGWRKVEYSGATLHLAGE